MLVESNHRLENAYLLLDDLALNIVRISARCSEMGRANCL